MPKTKRARLVHLTKTGKKNQNDAKEELITSFSSALKNHTHLILFQIKNMRSNFFHQLRQQLKEECDVEEQVTNSDCNEDILTSSCSKARIFFGKNRVLDFVLKRDLSETSERNKFCDLLKAQVAVVATSAPEKVKNILSFTGERDFSRAGCIATMDVVLPAGKPLHQVYDPEVLLPTSMENQLRLNGLTGLRRDKTGLHLVLDAPHTICKEGDKLTADQARLLKAFGVMMADFECPILATLSLKGQ